MKGDLKMKKFKFLRKALNVEEIKEWDKNEIGRHTEVRIEKIIELPEDEYNEFSRTLLADTDFIKENKDLMGVDIGRRWHCILVKAKTRKDAILVQCEGFNYARYTSYVENADELIEK